MDIFGNFPKISQDEKKRKVANKQELDYSYATAILDPISKIEQKNHLRFSPVLKIILIFVFCVLSLQLFNLQVIEGESFLATAEGNRTRPRIIEASRGSITDRNGAWLARNKPSFVLAAYPSDLPQKKVEREKVYEEIAAAAGLDIGEIRQEIEKNGIKSLDEVVLKENIPNEDALILEEKIADIPGVFVSIKSIREYDSSAGLAHILGYTGIISKEDVKKTPGEYYASDRTGKSGIEQIYEKYLKGEHGVEEIEVNSKQSIVKVLVKDENKEPVPGDDVVLNIDMDLQRKVGDILKAGIDKATELSGSQVTGGVALVMDVNTGAMLSMVSYPSYDNNLFSGKISNEDYQKLLTDKDKPMFDRAIQGIYPPGSISKIILASAGLQEGVINVNTAFDTPPAIEVGDYVFPDNKDHGYTNIERALAESNNIFFYSIGGGYGPIKGIGIEEIKKYWQLFGLGEPTGIDLPGEASGLLPDPEWKERVKKEPWYLGDTYHVSIGQGDLLVTPLQMLCATAAIANGGKLVEPQLVQKIIAADGKVVKEFGPRIKRENFLDPSTINTVRKGMRMVVNDPSGSAHNLSNLPVSVAGKTGTAQFLNNEKTHAWFISYAPYEKPEIAVVTLVDGGGGGYAIASPLAGEIIDYYFTRGN